MISILDKDDFPQVPKNAPKAKVLRRAAPFHVTLLAGRYFCMSITVPDFRFSSRYDFHTSITNPPLTYLGPGKRTLVRGGRKRFYPNTISRLNLEFPVLNKMKVSTKESRGVVRMGEICPHPPLTARQMLMVGLLWWLRILDPARVTPLTINQWITVGPIVSGEDSVI